MTAGAAAFFFVWNLPTRAWIKGSLRDGRLTVEAGTGRVDGFPAIRRRYSWEIAEIDWINLTLRFHYRNPVKRAVTEVSWEDLVHGLEGKPWTAGSWLASRVDGLDISLIARVGTGNPVTTALAAGGLGAAVGGLLTWLDAHWPLMGEPRISIAPYFGSPVLAGEFSCIVGLRVGDIILAGWLAFWARRRASRSAGRRPPARFGRRNNVKGVSRWSTLSRAL